VIIPKLVKLFVKEPDNPSSPSMRQKYAIVCSEIGICLNIVLCVGKLMAGITSGSVAIMADGFNNLADAGGALISMFGFLFAGIGASQKHLFGHGRIEWLIGLFTSFTVIYMGIELIKISWEAISSPSPVIFDIKIFAVLFFAIIIKLYMYYYNKKIGRQIDSSAMRAVAVDSFSDAIATAVVLLSMVVSRFTSIHALDGWCGIMVSICIIYAGYKTAIETINRIIGVSPEPKILAEVREIVDRYPQIIGIYNPIVHDYGLGQMIMSMHIEADAAVSTDKFQVVSEEIAYELYEKLGCSCTIQMDFIVTDEKDRQEIYARLFPALEHIHADIEVETLRILKNESYKSIVLDLLLPVQLQKMDIAVSGIVEKSIQSLNKNYRVILKIRFKKRKSAHRLGGLTHGK